MQTASGNIIQTKDEEAVLEEDDLLGSVRADLAEIFLYWYGRDVASKILKQTFNRQGSLILCTDTTNSKIPSDTDIPAKLTEVCWYKTWFPRKEEQEGVDDFFSERFGSLLDHDTPEYECVTTLQPDCLWEALALIVLFDPIAQSVYRSSPEKASLTSQKALHYALEMVDNGTVHKLPFHFKSTVLISLGNSRDPAAHDVLGHLLRSADFDPYLQSHEKLAHSLRAGFNQRERAAHKRRVL